jgi:hypothetical protein
MKICELKTILQLQLSTATKVNPALAAMNTQFD